MREENRNDYNWTMAVIGSPKQKAPEQNTTAESGRGSLKSTYIHKANAIMNPKEKRQNTPDHHHESREILVWFSP